VRAIKKRLASLKHKGHGPPRLNADAVAVAVDQIEIVCLAESPHTRHQTCPDGIRTRAQEPSADRAASGAHFRASLFAPLPGRYYAASLFSYTQTADDFAVMVGVSLVQVVQ